jgi:hypothetical protein
VFILVGFSPCSHRLLFLLQTGQTSHTNSFGGGGASEGMERWSLWPCIGPTDEKKDVRVLMPTPQ